ncbi:unnamed protein product [Brassica oleracea]
MLEVSYPWLPPGCDVCRKWGHKGTECSAKNIEILQKEKGSNLPLVVADGDQRQQKNPVSELLQELEEFTPYAPLGNGVEVNKMLNSIVLGAGMVEVGQSGKTPDTGRTVSDGIGGSSTPETGVSEVSGQLNVSREEVVGGSVSGGITVSLSRFQALADISEEEEVETDELSETEEGEIVADHVEKVVQETSQRQQKPTTVSQRGSQMGANVGKVTKKTIARSKDLKYA